MAACADRLMRVTIEQRPAVDVIATYGKHDALIYCDPPYLGAARADDGAAYVDELLSETAHRDLAEALHATPAAVILSGYPSDLYDSDLYADWYRAERTVTRRPSNRASGPMAHATEVLWSNRPLATQGTLRLDVG